MEKSANKIITVGKLKLTLPSFITAVCGIIVGLATSIKINPFVGLAAVVPFLIAAYTVNCTVVGHCTTWAWVLTVLYVVNVAIVFLGVSFLDSTKSRVSTLVSPNLKAISKSKK
jgi:hypothetical protein